MSEPLNRAELVEQAAVASYLQSEPQPDQFPWDRESGAMRNHHRGVGEAVTKVITRAITDRVRALHRPHECSPGILGDCFIVHGGGCTQVGSCAGCSWPYPCPTVRELDAIDAEMGVER